MENVLKIWQECNRCVYVDLDDGSKFEFIYGFFSSKRDEGFIQIWYFYRNGECHREDLTSNVSTYEVKRLGRCGNSPALECFERLDEEAREKVKKFIPEKLSYLLDVGLRLLNSIGERVLDKYEKEMELENLDDYEKLWKPILEQKNKIARQMYLNGEEYQFAEDGHWDWRQKKEITKSASLSYIIPALVK